jgi:hypothetical protein
VHANRSQHTLSVSSASLVGIHQTASVVTGRQAPTRPRWSDKRTLLGRLATSEPTTSKRLQTLADGDRRERALGFIASAASLRKQYPRPGRAHQTKSQTHMQRQLASNDSRSMREDVDAFRPLPPRIIYILGQNQTCQDQPALCVGEAEPPGLVLYDKSRSRRTLATFEAPGRH